MPSKEHFRELLHTDPETFPGALTDEQIIEMNKLGGPPTPAERQGFLEMWRYEYVKRAIGSLNPKELEALIVDAGERTEILRDLQKEASELDWIIWMARSSRLATSYRKEE